MSYTANSVQTGDFKTHYLEEGSGDPVILLHGGGAGADGRSNWSTCLPLFAQRRRVLVPDLVGFGHTEKPDPAEFSYTQDARNRQIVAFIESLELERVSIVGNSMGGATGLGVAMLRPELVDNLVLMGSAGLSNPPNPALATILDYDFTLEGMRRIIGALANPGFSATDEQLQYRYELSVEPATRAAYTATMDWIREHGLGYPTEEISKVKARTLVFHGKDDLVVPVANGYKFLELLDNSTGYLMPQCRHWAMLEYPDLFASVVLDFLDRYSPAAAR